MPKCLMFRFGWHILTINGQIEINVWLNNCPRVIPEKARFMSNSNKLFSHALQLHYVWTLKDIHLIWIYLKVCHRWTIRSWKAVISSINDDSSHLTFGSIYFFNLLNNRDILVGMSFSPSEDIISFTFCKQPSTRAVPNGLSRTTCTILAYLALAHLSNSRSNWITAQINSMDMLGREKKKGEINYEQLLCNVIHSKRMRQLLELLHYF